jgi:hypothetical protein
MNIRPPKRTPRVDAFVDHESEAGSPQALVDDQSKVSANFAKALEMVKLAMTRIAKRIV